MQKTNSFSPINTRNPAQNGDRAPPRSVCANTMNDTTMIGRATSSCSRPVRESIVRQCLLLPSRTHISEKGLPTQNCTRAPRVDLPAQNRGFYKILNSSHPELMVESNTLFSKHVHNVTIKLSECKKSVLTLSQSTSRSIKYEEPRLSLEQSNRNEFCTHAQ